MLFGSRARGDFTESSDYDVLYVDDIVPRDPRKVSNELFLKVLYMFPGEVDPVFMNTEIFLRKLKDGVPFLLQILEEGKVLERDEKFWEEVTKIFQEKGKNGRELETCGERNDQMTRKISTFNVWELLVSEASNTVP
ncbi:hypothetical protein L3N51_02342 [Metallosphaera sp. J1]|uniref:nucleotidyltransferase domain-containing protein n=1 Tax=Metallosphaera javensis (ex Hofmann et al. 2022) TaxID=99938 RepID=UPI001EDF9BDA|nr:nucleotidyltransferase domain-containing protein [Metallosphaera javensis (ex Hofmann et al. 2022)]MCG3110045.1 hypothetical protein [Metallosphaera javensis (ex Hofmann et al. 2022)]